MSKGFIETGSVAGTGASINVSLGFTPIYVRVVNEDSSGLATMEWFEGMADAEGFKSVAAAGNSMVTSLGITPYAGTIGGVGKGFTIGADTDVNVSAEDLHWLAMGRAE